MTAGKRVKLRARRRSRKLRGGRAFRPGEATAPAARAPAPANQSRCARPPGLSGRARTGSPRRALGRRPGRHHDVLDPRCALRLRAPLGPFARDRRPDRVSRARGTDGPRDGAGPGVARTRAVRAPNDGRSRGCPAGREPRNDSRRVRRRRREPRAGRCEPLRERPDRRCWRVRARASRQLPPDRACLASRGRGLLDVHRLRLLGRSRVELGRARACRAVPAGRWSGVGRIRGTSGSTSSPAPS